MQLKVLHRGRANKNKHTVLCKKFGHPRLHLSCLIEYIYGQWKIVSTIFFTIASNVYIQSTLANISQDIYFFLLQELGDVEKYFQDVVATVQERIEDVGSERDQYSTRLQQLYHDILSSTVKSR